MSTTNIPGVGALTSSALTVAQMNLIWQDLILQMLGIAPSGPTDPIAYAAVRLDFPTGGQPSWLITEDVGFIACEEVPDTYNEIHEQSFAPNDAESFLQTDIYTRVWKITLDFWGPNSFDRARQVKSCMYQCFAHDTLAASNLYLDTTFPTPRRAPELFQGNWWERVHFSVRMNEQVTETLVLPSMASVEVSIQTPTAIISDQVIEL
jgi:hypothetical protein